MSYIAERRLEEKDRRRGQILDAAEATASSVGIDTLTMEQVARRARISRALLYVYFKDKTDLHYGLCERGIAQLTARFEEAAARHRNGQEQLAAMGRAYVAFSQEFPVYFEALSRFQASESGGGAAEGGLASCLAAGDRVHRIMIESVEAGMRDGSIARSAGSPEAIAMSLWGFMHGIIQLTATKSPVLAQYGLNGRQLVDQALHLASRALAPSAT